MAIEYAMLRSQILEYLKSNPNDQVNLHSDYSLRRFLSQRDLSPDEKDLETIQEIFHELYLERIIITGAGPKSLGNSAMGWPFYRVSEYGKKVLDSSEYIPYDPEGYLRRIKSELPSIDSIIIRYLEEALGSFRSNFLLSSGVMIGCAAEKALLLLIDTFGTAITDPAKKKKYEKDTEHWIIGRKYAALWKRLEPLASSLPRNLGDDLHIILDRIRDLIMTTRNEAGHPTGKIIEKETVHANLILFPSYCRRIYELIDYFTKNPVP